MTDIKSLTEQIHNKVAELNQLIEQANSLKLLVDIEQPKFLGSNSEIRSSLNGIVTAKIMKITFEY